MTRPGLDPQGVSYRGDWPVYDVLLHGDKVGLVASNRRRHGIWTASCDATWTAGAWVGLHDGDYWRGATRAEAAAGLIASLPQRAQREALNRAFERRD